MNQYEYTTLDFEIQCARFKRGGLFFFLVLAILNKKIRTGSCDKKEIPETAD